MKKLNLFLSSIILMMITSTILQAQDWANLGRYQDENASIGLPEKGDNRVVFMGNSITEGWGPTGTGYFERKPYINRGISGQTSPQMLLRFRQDVIQLKPSVVVILAGTNDIAENTGPTTLEMIMGNIISMVELANANGIKVVLSSVLPAYTYAWNPEIEPAEKIFKLNAMIKDYAEDNKIVYLDYYTSMVDERKGLQSALSPDGVHPNEAGYAIMFPLAEAAIARALKQKSK